MARRQSTRNCLTTYASNGTDAEQLSNVPIFNIKAGAVTPTTSSTAQTTIQDANADDSPPWPSFSPFISQRVSSSTSPATSSTHIASSYSQPNKQHKRRRNRARTARKSAQLATIKQQQLAMSKHPTPSKDNRNDWSGDEIDSDYEPDILVMPNTCTRTLAKLVSKQFSELSVESQKGNNYFNVSKLTRVVTNSKTGQRFFLTHWKDSLFKGSKVIKWKPTWQSEASLTGCRDMVAKILLKKKLPPSKLLFLAGNSGGGNAKESNFLTLDQIIHYSRIYAKNQNSQFYAFDTSIGFREDGIYFLVQDEHCFVFLFIRATLPSYVLGCDGANSFRNYIEDSSEAERTVKTQVKWLDFVGQRATDHCASSAVLIAREFGLLHKNLIQDPNFAVPQKIIGTKSIRNSFIPLVHKDSSDKIAKDIKNHAADHKYLCPHCNKKYIKRPALTCHIRNNH